MSEDLLMDLRETLNAYQKYKNVSWSKYQEFGKCPGQWFSRNFARFIKAEATGYESTRAIGGIIIQRLFESFINDRVYLRSEMKTLQDLVNWFETNTRGLFHLVTFDLEKQWIMDRPRYYFRRTQGKNRIDAHRKEYNLDTVLRKGIQPQFIDWQFFAQEEGGKDTFIEKLQRMYLPILQNWVEMDIDLNKMLSEIWVQANIYQDVVINGKTDFVYNKFQKSGLFDDVKHLQNAFVLMDGKFNISKYVQKEQLFFYSTALYLRYKKYPTHVILVNWSKALMKIYDFDLNYVQKLKNNIISMIEVAHQVGAYIAEKRREGSTSLNILDIPSLKFKASQKSCLFCPIKKYCPAAIEKGLDKEDMIHGIITKRQTEAALREAGVSDSDEAVHELKL